MYCNKNLGYQHPNHSVPLPVGHLVPELVVRSRNNLVREVDLLCKDLDQIEDDTGANELEPVRD